MKLTVAETSRRILDGRKLYMYRVKNVSDTMIFFSSK